MRYNTAVDKTAIGPINTLDKEIINISTSQAKLIIANIKIK